MEMCDEDKSNDDIQEPSLEDKFSKLFCELEHCNEDEQKQKIEEMNEIVDGMNIKEFISIFTKKLFNKMDKMIEEKKMSMENAILLLKHAGYLKTLKNMWSRGFFNSELKRRFEKMILEEEKKNEGKNERLLADFCGCYIFLCCSFTPEVLSICSTCFLKAASSKDKEEETQKEVEIAFFALNYIEYLIKIDEDQYLNKIKEIIKYHQEHRNLSPLAYHCAWESLKKRLLLNGSLERMIMNELHFAREARRELGELMKCIDWKRKEEENGKRRRRRDIIEELTLMRWLRTLDYYIYKNKLKNEEITMLIGVIVQVYRAAKGNNEEISCRCIYSLRNAAERRDMRIEGLLESGATDTALEEIQRQTLNEDIMNDCFQFLVNVSRKLKQKNKDEREEEERKATKRKVFEKLEEEGYEDTITSFHETLKILNARPYHTLSLKISDYFVYV
ncbi:uncharacterized protein MONOS_17639 [Monocercomonoides exilis]|uniref:uncharacterized protein n=1 Tax=Monocercomonoides exilis TaxID=2049356 RepID=UPI003559E7D3|nr:hypothetical protein MONOS_17639 [Monocercomonoides exilis]